MAAKVGMITGMGAYAFFTFINIQNVLPFFANSDGDLHWIHGYFISFSLSILVMVLLGYFYPKSYEEIEISEKKDPAPVDMTPWDSAKKVSAGIIFMTMIIYLALTWISN